LDSSGGVVRDDEKLQTLIEERAALSRGVAENLATIGLCDEGFLDQDIRFLDYDDDLWDELWAIADKVGCVHKEYVEERKALEAAGEWDEKTEAEKLAFKRGFSYDGQWRDEQRAQNITKLAAVRNAIEVVNNQINLHLATSSGDGGGLGGGPFSRLFRKIRRGLGFDRRHDVPEVFD